jgi:hypothetical protein
MPSPARPRTTALTALALAAACSSATDPQPCDDGQCVERVAVAAARRYLRVGDTTRVQAEVTVRGSATPTTVAWRAEQPAIATVSAQGLVTAVALGRGVITAVPTADDELTASVFFDVVSGDTAAAPVFAAITNPANGGAVEPGGQVVDSLDLTLEYVSGTRAGQQVTGVQLRLAGTSGRDTTLTLTPAAGTGIGRSSTRLRFGPPPGQTERAFPVGAYAGRAILQLANGQGIAIDVSPLFTVAR